MRVTNVNAIVSDLNRGGGNWSAVEGVRALTQVSKEADNYNFNPATGILVKVFINNNTGEMKLFPALMITDAF